jgi:SET domain-containing protein
MMTVPCYLAPSSIEGLGVFCHHDIAKGQVIWEHNALMDVRLPKSEVAKLPAHVREFIDRYAYTDVLDASLVVLESDEGRFMNHSPTPNTVFDGVNEGYARVDIPAGTEITCDYAEFETDLSMQPSRHRIPQAGITALPPG